VFAELDRAKNVFRGHETAVKSDEAVASEIERNVLPELTQQFNFVNGTYS
jgi:hypothetical protein